MQLFVIVIEDILWKGMVNLSRIELDRSTVIFTMKNNAAIPVVMNPHPCTPQCAVALFHLRSQLFTEVAEVKCFHLKYSLMGANHDRLGRIYRGRENDRQIDKTEEVPRDRHGHNSFGGLSWSQTSLQCEELKW